jgi:hypothetical protein
MLHCAAVGPGVLPVSARLRQALQRSFESTFALYNFPVCLAGCNVLSTGGHDCVPVRRLSRLHLHHSCVLAMQPRKSNCLIWLLPARRLNSSRCNQSQPS